MMMPVQKFRSYQDLGRPFWPGIPSSDYFTALAQLWDFAGKSNPARWPRGVFKYRSIEEANLDRARWTTEHVRRLRHGGS